MEPTVLSVTQLNQFIKNRLDNEPLLQRVCVRGELSNYKVYPSGHHYFTLKDGQASVHCVMFKSSAASLRFWPENGMAVLAFGKISVYPRDGAYQLYCSRLLPDGAGDLNLAFEQLKKKLFEEGLFDREKKKPLPRFPHRIGIVTSPAGAAIHDMLRILGKRYPLSKVILLPARVQGAEAPPEIAAAIQYANQHKLCDLLIVGRGGGSLEDLWAFNDERVARAIYASEIPVVSAVGHEPDVTISDFVADLRAATPSNAAELVAPDQLELRAALQGMQAELRSTLTRKLTLSRQLLNNTAGARVLQDPLAFTQERRMDLDRLSEKLVHAQQTLVAKQKHELVRQSASLDAMSPLKVLTRGYSIAQKEDGTLIRSAAQVRVGENLRLTTGQGSIHTAVTSIEEVPNEPEIEKL